VTSGVSEKNFGRWGGWGGEFGLDPFKGKVVDWFWWNLAKRCIKVYLTSHQFLGIGR